MTGYGEFEKAIHMLEEGKVRIDPLVTGHIQLDQLPSMLEDLASHKADHIKVMVYPY